MSLVNVVPKQTPKVLYEQKIVCKNALIIVISYCSTIKNRSFLSDKGEDRVFEDIILFTDYKFCNPFLR